MGAVVECMEEQDDDGSHGRSCSGDQSGGRVRASSPSMPGRGPGTLNLEEEGSCPCGEPDGPALAGPGPADLAWELTVPIPSGDSSEIIGAPQEVGGEEHVVAPGMFDFDEFSDADKEEGTA